MLLDKLVAWNIKPSQQTKLWEIETINSKTNFKKVSVILKGRPEKFWPHVVHLKPPVKAVS